MLTFSFQFLRSLIANTGFLRNLMITRRRKIVFMPANFGLEVWMLGSLK